VGNCAVALGYVGNRVVSSKNCASCVDNCVTGFKNYFTQIIVLLIARTKSHGRLC
jgi:hypothetical protein